MQVSNPVKWQSASFARLPFACPIVIPFTQVEKGATAFVCRYGCAHYLAAGLRQFAQYPLHHPAALCRAPVEAARGVSLSGWRLDTLLPFDMSPMPCFEGSSDLIAHAWGNSCQPSGKSSGERLLKQGAMPSANGRNGHNAQSIEGHTVTCCRHVPAASLSNRQSRHFAAIAALRVAGAAFIPPLPLLLAR